VLSAKRGRRSLEAVRRAATRESLASGLPVLSVARHEAAEPCGGGRAPAKPTWRQWFSDGIGGEGDNFLLYFIFNS
jgi:hypothetical protein